MADDINKNDISNATNVVANSINQTEQSISNSISDAVKGAEAAISNVTQALNKEGIQLSALKDQVDKDINNMGDYFQTIIAHLVNINNVLLSIANQSKNEENQVLSLVEKEPEEESDIKQTSNKKTDAAININTSALTASDIGAETTLANITGTGFSVLANILNNMSGSILTGFNQMTQALISAKMPLTQSQQTKQATEASTTKTESGNKNTALTEFFTQLAEPLNSIASGILLLTVAATILGSMGLNGTLVQGMLLFGTMMFTAFFVLKQISKFYQTDMIPIMDQSSAKDPSNVLYVIQSLSNLIITINAMVLLSIVTMQIVQTNLGTLCLGLLVTFGSVVISLFALSALGQIGAPAVSKDSDFMQLVNGFVHMMVTVTAIALICGLLLPILQQGFEAMLTLVVLTELSIGGIVLMAQRLSNIDKGVLTAFQSLLESVTIMIGLLGVLTIVLGIIPISIITQGIVTVTLLTGLTLSIIGMTMFGIKSIQKVPAEQIYAFMGVLIASIACIAVLSILTVVLAQQNMASLYMALGAIVVISAIPVVLFKLMSGLGKKAGSVFQALLGASIAAALTIAVAYMANLIIGLLGVYTLAQVVVTVAAVGAISVLMIAMAGFITLMGLLSPAIQVAAIPALIGTAITAGFAITIAGLANLLSTILPAEIAQTAMQSAMAIAATSVSFVIIGVSIVALGGLAIPLMASSLLAVLALNRIVAFTGVLSAAIAELQTSEIEGGVDVETIQSLKTAMTSMVQIALLIPLLAIHAPLVAISSIGALITIGAVTATALALQVGVSQIQDVGEKTTEFQHMKNALRSMGSFVQTLNSLPVINPLKVIGAFAILSTAKSLESKLSTLGNEEKIQKVQNLTNTLAQLAGQQQSLNGLANALQNVAKATETLQQVQTSNKITVNKGIESLSGEESASIQSIYQSKTSSVQNTTNVDMDDIKEALGEMLGLLREIKTASWENLDQAKRMETFGESNTYMQSSLADV